MQLGLMIEGQAGLTWVRWQRILKAAEDLGFAFVFRSDHYTDAAGPHRESLECWVSLTYAATATHRIQFGSMVSPVTFRHPVLLTRMAAAVDDLSGGRLVFGLGAGWQEREHRAFGVPFHDFTTRYAMFEEALELTTRLLDSDEPVSYAGKHFSLEDAILLPRPQRRTPILIGGNGEKRTLPLVARYADEWNAVFVTADTYRERMSLLDQLCVDRGRDPKSITRSMMTRIVYMRDDTEFKASLAAAGGDLFQFRRDNRMIAGTPSMILDQIHEYEAAGCERIMIQWLDLDDMDRLEHMANTLLPHFRQG